MSHEIKIIVGSLLEIKSNIRADRLPLNGLCRTFLIVHGESLAQCMKLYGIRFQDWQHFSGDKDFPIPYINEEFSASEAYHFRAKYTGEYGKLRLKLLDWLIEQFHSKVKKIHVRVYANAR